MLRQESLISNFISLYLGFCTTLLRLQYLSTLFEGFISLVTGVEKKLFLWYCSVTQHPFSGSMLIKFSSSFNFLTICLVLSIILLITVLLLFLYVFLMKFSFNLMYSFVVVCSFIRRYKYLFDVFYNFYIFLLDLRNFCGLFEPD